MCITQNHIAVIFFLFGYLFHLLPFSLIRAPPSARALKLSKSKNLKGCDPSTAIDNTSATIPGVGTGSV